MSCDWSVSHPSYMQDEGIAAAHRAMSVENYDIEAVKNSLLEVLDQFMESLE